MTITFIIISIILYISGSILTGILVFEPNEDLPLIEHLKSLLFTIFWPIGWLIISILNLIYSFKNR